MQRTDLVSVLDREFLQIRAALLDLAAALDRIDRDPNAKADDARRGQIRATLDRLVIDSPDRAEAVQRIFSLVYSEDWRRKYQL